MIAEEPPAQRFERYLKAVESGLPERYRIPGRPRPQPAPFLFRAVLRTMKLINVRSVGLLKFLRRYIQFR